MRARVLLAVVAVLAAGGPVLAGQAGPDRIIREADAVSRRSGRFDPGHGLYYAGRPWLAELTLRRCARGIPGMTPSARACRAAAGSIRR